MISLPNAARTMDAEPEDRDRRSSFDLGSVEHGANTGGDAAAEQTDLLQRSVLADLGYRDLGQNGVLGEGRGPHVVVDHLALRREP